MIDNTRGIFAMSASVVVFIFNDALIKLAAETVPSLQAVGVRGLFATLWCTLALLLSGAWRHIAMAGHRQVMLRGFLEAMAAIVYLVALFHIPFAIATAVNLATPLILTVLAVLLLKEDVRWRRWSAVILGFLGVLLVIQPQPGDLNAWTWVALLGTLIGALRDALSRYLPYGVPTLVVSFTTASVVAVAGCLGALIEGWQPMTERAVGLLLASSLLLALALARHPGPALARRVLGHGFVPLRFDPVGAWHRLRRLGRRAERPCPVRHCRDRRCRSLHPAPRAHAALSYE